MLASHPLGHIYQKDNLTVFFGNRESSTDEYRKTFLKWRFFRLKQIHSAVVHLVDGTKNDYEMQGDAAITTEKNFAICSITADCMPIFIFNQQRNVIAAIHSGWRGVAKRIIPATIQQMKIQGANPKENLYFVGPHILKSSFEVENHIKDELLASAPMAKNPKVSEAISDSKSLVDLLALAESQMREFSPDIQIVKHVFDTKTDLRYHSFRRDLEKSGRQVSFVCLT